MDSGRAMDEILLGVAVVLEAAALTLLLPGTVIEPIAELVFALLVLVDPFQGDFDNRTSLGALKGPLWRSWCCLRRTIARCWSSPI